MVAENYSMKEAEKNAIVRALWRTRGNHKWAAEILVIAKSTLYKKVQEYGILREHWNLNNVNDVSPFSNSPIK